MAGRLIAVAIAVMCFGSGAVRAQETLPDPTRPPAVMAQPAASDAPGTAAGPRLQSVLLPRNGRKPAAIIDGERVELGATHNGARLVAVREDRVILDAGGTRLELRLTPAAAKRPRPDPRRAAPAR